MIDADLHLVDTLDDALALKRWLGERRPVLAVDTETGGLDWWRDPLRLVQVGDAKSGWAIPFQDGWPMLVRELLDGYDGAVVAHNAGFDRTYLERGGVHLHGDVHDTLTRARLIEPWKPADLKRLTTELIDPTAWTGQAILDEAMRRQKWTWATVPWDFDWYWLYAALDTVLTARLYEHQQSHMAGLEDAYALELAVAEPLRRAELRGLRVDIDYCNAKMAELLAYADSVREWVREHYDINPGSNEKVASQLKRDGVELTKRTRSGALCVDVDVLNAVRDKHPLAEAVLNVRNAEKMANTYFGGLLEYVDGDVIHPRIKALGARTGRMSIERPSLQNQPRKRFIRDAFIARPGHKLLLCDFDQIELRLIAAFSQDAGLIDVCAADVDPFTMMTRLAHHDDTIAKSDNRRQRMKNGWYARSYGSGAAKFAATAGISFEEAQHIYDLMDERFPDVTAFQRAVEEAAQQRVPPYIVTPVGRRMPVPDDKLYVAVNYLIQGTAAEVFKQQLVDVERAGLGAYFCLPIHDEGYFDVPDEQVDEVKALLPEVMGTQWQGVPFPAGMDGPFERWGEKYS